MKKFFVVFTAFAFVMAMGLPAMAEVDVTVAVDADKDKTVTETIVIGKNIEIGVKQVVKPSSSAEAQTLKNDLNEGNSIIEVGVPAVPAGAPEYNFNPITKEYSEVPGTSSPGVPAVEVVKTATINDTSLDGAAGIINVNQSPGSINNQGNAVAMAYSAPAQPVTEIAHEAEGETRFLGGAFLHAESSADQKNGGLGVVDMGYNDIGDSIIVPLGNSVMATESTRTNEINSALGNATGIVGVNQSAGSINNQNNAASLSVGDGIAALAEADLGMCNSGNTSFETGTVTSDTLTASALASASGIIGINQSSGCMNNQANVVAASVLVHPHLTP